MSHPHNEKSWEADILLGNGRTARRCQARTRQGSQCTQPARSGFEVCWKHGAGSRKREEAKEKRPVGRPPVHGLYSQAGMLSIHELMQQVLALETDLDNTDKELALLKAALWHLLNQAVTFQAHATTVDKLLSDLQNIRLDATDSASLSLLKENQQLTLRLMQELRWWSTHLTDAALKVITAAKARADTRVKLAESKALEHFTTLITAVRKILWELLDEEQLDVFEDRLRKEVFGPQRIVLAAPPIPEMGVSN